MKHCKTARVSQATLDLSILTLLGTEYKTVARPFEHCEYSDVSFTCDTCHLTAISSDSSTITLSHTGIL